MLSRIARAGNYTIARHFPRGLHSTRAHREREPLVLHSLAETVRSSSLVVLSACRRRCLRLLLLRMVTRPCGSPGLRSPRCKLPGRENRLREPALTDLDATVELVGAAIAASESVEPARPFAFFGHSMGAIVAFELTRWLRERGRALPVHLFVSGSSAPDVRFEKTPLCGITDAAAFLAAVAARYGGIPDAVANDPEFSALIAPTLRADLTMNERYQYRDAARLAVSISAYGGCDDAEVSRRGAGRLAPPDGDGI